MGRDDEIRLQWDRAVDSWVEFVRGGKDYYREFMNGPALKRMMGDVGGMRVLDIACGEGYFSRLYAGEGASVTGVDFSERMIDAAVEEEERDPLGVEYHVADASDLSMLESGSFDVAFNFMALMDMDDYESAIGEASRVLKRGGRFVFAITHPCFEIRSLDGAEVCGWETRISPDGAKEYLFLWVRDYFRRHSDSVEWKKSERRPYGFTTTSFHRTLSDYVNALSKHGLLVRRIEEPTPTEEGVAVHPSLAKHRNVPHSIVIESVKM